MLPLDFSITNVPSGIFEGVVSGNIIITIRNTKSLSLIEIKDLSGNSTYKQNKERLGSNLTININSSDKTDDTIEKIESAQIVRVGDIFNVHVGMMIKDKKTLFSLNEGGDRIVTGRQLNRFGIKSTHTFNFADAIVFGGTKNLTKHKTSPKILIRKTGDSIISVVDNGQVLAEQSVYLVLPKDRTSPEAVVAVLNSTISTFYFRSKLVTNIDSYPYIQHYDLIKMPIPLNLPSNLSELSFDMSNHTESLTRLTARFESIIRSEHVIEKWPTKLNKWWTLDFTDFTKALKIKLTLQQKDELLQLFDKYRTELIELGRQIQQIDHEIDQLVYKLYDLTPEEIAIVEKI